MKIFNFDKDSGREIINFDSNHAIFSRIIQPNKPVHIGVIYIGSEGIVGAHPATVHQLFLVVNGQGWVVGKEGIKYIIQAGQAAYWEAGEVHESGSEEGMMTIVIEGEDVLPLMTELEWLES